MSRLRKALRCPRVTVSERDEARFYSAWYLFLPRRMRTDCRTKHVSSYYLDNWISISSLLTTLTWSYLFYCWQSKLLLSKYVYVCRTPCSFSADTNNRRTRSKPGNKINNILSFNQVTEEKKNNSLLFLISLELFSKLWNQWVSSDWIRFPSWYMLGAMESGPTLGNPTTVTRRILHRAVDLSFDSMYFIRGHTCGNSTER